MNAPSVIASIVNELFTLRGAVVAQNSFDSLTMVTKVGVIVGEPADAFRKLVLRLKRIKVSERNFYL